MRHSAIKSTEAKITFRVKLPNNFSRNMDIKAKDTYSSTTKIHIHEINYLVIFGSVVK